VEKYREKLNIIDVESNIRKAKLREAERLRQELEGKLENIDRNINDLKAIEEAAAAKRKNLMDSEVRKEYYENEKIKTEQVAEKIRVYMKQQKNFQKALAKQINKIEKNVEKQRKIDEYNAQYVIFERKERIKEERTKMKEKYEKRLQETEELKKIQSEKKLTPKQKPLFLKYEERYKSQIIMPELERRKEELKQKRLYYSPIPQQSIKEHAEWYSSMKEDHNKQFNKELQERILESKIRESEMGGNEWNLRAIEEKRRFKEENSKKFREKMELLEKRNNYADLVQEMYSPALDIQKKPEKSKQKSKDTKSDGEKPAKKPWKPTKFKPNSMIPRPKAKKPPIELDYLKDQRLIRRYKEMSGNATVKANTLIEEEDLPSGPISARELEKVKKKVKQLDDLARKQSLLIQNTPDSIIAMKETESVDNLLLGSIKTKLKILDKFD
jgi:hypothetical protein